MWIMLLRLHVNQKPDDDDDDDVLLTMELFLFENSMDPDQLASDEAG